MNEFDFDLIRHAMTSWNLDKKIQGSTDIPLAPEGIVQVKAWAKLLPKRTYAKIISSPLKRALQTAQTIADVHQLPVKIEHGLCEQDFGLWEGEQIQQLRKTAPGKVEAQEAKGWEFCPPEGESRMNVLERVCKVLGDIRMKNKGPVLVVTHSSVIKCLVYKALGRQFLPGEKKVLKPWHVQALSWQNGLCIREINCLDLSLKEKSKKEDR